MITAATYILTALPFLVVGWALVMVVVDAARGHAPGAVVDQGRRVGLRRALLFVVVALFFDGLLNALYLGTPAGSLSDSAWPTIVKIGIQLTIAGAGIAVIAFARPWPRIARVIVLTLVGGALAGALLQSASLAGMWSYYSGWTALRAGATATAMADFEEHGRQADSPGLQLESGVRLTRYGVVQDLSARGYSAVGDAYVGMRQYEKALPYLRMALDRARMADSLDDASQIEEAIKTVETALKR